jgi:hypothetical protein
MAASRQDVTRSARSGRLVPESTAERDPRHTITEKVRANTSAGTREIHRSATTGRFVKQTTAERHASTTETHRP